MSGPSMLSLKTKTRSGSIPGREERFNGLRTQRAEMLFSKNMSICISRVHIRSIAGDLEQSTLTEEPTRLQMSPLKRRRDADMRHRLDSMSLIRLNEFEFRSRIPVYVFAHQVSLRRNGVGDVFGVPTFSLLPSRDLSDSTCWVFLLSRVCSQFTGQLGYLDFFKCGAFPKMIHCGSM